MEKVTNKRKYAINIEAFFELITKKNQNEKNNDTTITEIWQPDTDGELKIVNKEMVENKYSVNNDLCTMRYDFINGLIYQILSTSTLNECTFLENEEQFTFGQWIVFNTLLKEGVIYEINE